jgi:hypothetical protein
VKNEKFNKSQLKTFLLEQKKEKEKKKKEEDKARNEMKSN